MAQNEPIVSNGPAQARARHGLKEVGLTRFGYDSCLEYLGFDVKHDPFSLAQNGSNLPV